MSIINVNRWQNKVRAFFGIRGDNPIPTIKDLLPVVVVEDDRPEWRYSGGELLCWNVQTQAIVAAQFSYVALVNPPGTGVIAVVDEVSVFGGSSTNVWVIGPAGIAASAPYLGASELGSSTSLQRDLRMLGGVVSSGDQIPATRLAFGAAAVLPFVLCYVLPSGQRHPTEIILPPDTAVIFSCATLATAFTCGIRFRERVFERGVTS